MHVECVLHVSSNVSALAYPCPVIPPIAHAHYSINNGSDPRVPTNVTLT